IWEALRAAGVDVPDSDIDEDRSQRAVESEERITTAIDIRPVLARKREALFAHGTQVNGDSWFGKIPPEIVEEAFGYEYFIRAADTAGAPLPEDVPFAGLRTGACPVRGEQRSSGPAWRPAGRWSRRGGRRPSRGQRQPGNGRRQPRNGRRRP